jgi:hypothetical protein
LKRRVSNVKSVPYIFVFFFNIENRVPFSFSLF